MKFPVSSMFNAFSRLIGHHSSNALAVNTQAQSKSKLIEVPAHLLWRIAGGEGDDSPKGTWGLPPVIS